MSSSKNCLIFVATGSEPLEAVATIDVLRRAGINVTISGLDEKEVKCCHDIILKCEKTASEIKENTYDIVVIPGGIPGVDNIAKDETVKSVLSKHIDADKYIAAICAGPRVLMKNEMFKGKKVTSYPHLNKEFASHFNWINEKVVQDGKLITSQGPSTSMLFALKIVENLCGEEKSKEIAKQLLFLQSDTIVD